MACTPPAARTRPPGCAGRATTISRTSRSRSAPNGMARSRTRRRGSGPVSSLPGISIMIANTNSTMMAPAYTITCAAARNCAPSVRYRTAMLPRLTTRKRAPWTGLRRRTSPSAEPTPIRAASTKTPTCTSGRPVRRDRHRRPRLAVGPGGLQGEEHLLCVDHPPAAVGGELQDPGVHPDRVFRARLHAVAAEYALAEVDRELRADLLDVGVGMLAGHDVDAAGGAHGLAHHAGHAARRAVFAPHQPVQAPQPRRHRPPLLRVLDGDGAARVGAAERVRDVLAHVGEEMVPGQHEPRQHFTQVEALADSHGCPPHASSTAPVSTMFRIESGKSPSQPRRIAWS